MKDSDIEEKSLKELQKELSQSLILEDSFNSVEKVAGVDQAFTDRFVYSGLIVQDKSFLNLEKKCARAKIKFPYIPGLLAFREIPSMLKVWKKAEGKADLLFVDGHGIAHPRGLGLASHIGIVLDVPTIGIAKNVLVGCFEEPEKVGEAKDLEYGGEVVGKVLKSKEDCNPIFISPGHKISLETSLNLVRKFLKDHKLPEPTYEADRLVEECKEKN
ncbi:hypothetical protein AKJ51_02290 [candidate division MSBL1 archaeon SCGC-AAA382A20]|uniref:Endonuclease V n=1 Tax=candidate division MSBL1 archaeon SCGC-AAA382A20 TaxID=1698280 RepID=A0A133VKQ2_9EURY|nr:hypothetical protein AKJ51_02290 [candidate division MSBL1 archaeon SCGC-AAA382A20]